MKCHHIWHLRELCGMILNFFNLFYMKHFYYFVYLFIMYRQYRWPYIVTYKMSAEGCPNIALLCSES
jgi:hypothetical protein